MPDPDTEHGLRIQLATALRERDEAKDMYHRYFDRLCASESERDSLRTALTEVNDLLMSVPPGEDWRAVVREKVVTALHGEPGWKET